MRRISFWVGMASVVSALLLSSCAGPEQSHSGKLEVVATTTIVADIVRQVGGDLVEVTVLIPANVDEHSYEPAPQDIARVSSAALVFMNGAGLEAFIEKLVEDAGSEEKLVSVSQGIELLEGPGHAGEEEELEEGEHEDGDPHVWTDPNNVKVWADNIAAALKANDPQNSDQYQKNADAYKQQLTELDAWIRQQVDQVPEANRKLVTDHTIFTYFASRYNFEQVGAVVPGYSTLSAPSAQEVAQLESVIREQKVPAIFVGNTVNPALAERIAQDTQTRLVPILTGSLSNGDGPAPTYIDYIQYNVSAIVEALK